MPSSPRPRILVVDDDPGIREALAAGLAGAYEIAAAANGAEACTALRAESVDGIILDAVLGDEQGIACVPRFRRLSSAPIVILTGHSTEALAIDALRAHVSDYLTKPVRLPELQAALQRLLGPPEGAADLAHTVRRLLDSYPGRPFRPTELARRLGVSEAHLRRTFQAATGQTPRRYLTARRLERAAELLRTTRRGVEELALELGFPSGAKLARAFRHRYGVSPSQCRATPPAAPSAQP